MLLRRRTDLNEALKKVPLFRNLSTRHLSYISRHADQVEREANKLVFRQGEIGRELVIIVDGSVRVVQDQQVIAHRHAGEFLGEMSLLDGKPRSATVITDIPCTLLIIHRSSFGPLLESVPGLAQKML